ncbi:MAG TPA: hypothetical protein VE441_11465 [Mycobacterium sp.]|nr:hypothetical protein [Mycobacterium sp.]
MSMGVTDRLRRAIVLTQMAMVVVSFPLLAIWSLVLAAPKSVVGGLALFAIVAIAFPLTIVPIHHRLRQMRATQFGQNTAH